MSSSYRWFERHSPLTLHSRGFLNHRRETQQLVSMHTRGYQGHAGWHSNNGPHHRGCGPRRCGGGYERKRVHQRLPRVPEHQIQSRKSSLAACLSAFCVENHRFRWRASPISDSLSPAPHRIGSGIRFGTVHQGKRCNCNLRAGANDEKVPWTARQTLQYVACSGVVDAAPAGGSGAVSLAVSARLPFCERGDAKESGISSLFHRGVGTRQLVNMW
jgi:hypothetical protein